MVGDKVEEANWKGLCVNDHCQNSEIKQTTFRVQTPLTAVELVGPVLTLVVTIAEVVSPNAAVYVGTFEQFAPVARFIYISTTLMHTTHRQHSTANCFISS